MLDVLKQMEDDPPDILVINSVLWDLHRYGRWADGRYDENIQKAASRLEDIMATGKNGYRRLLIWSMSLPVSSQSRSGFVGNDYEGTVGGGVHAANQTAKSVMRKHGAEVVDFHQLFDEQKHHRVKDGVHWDAVAHRRITNYLLLLIANHCYGHDHPKSIKAKKILAGNPVSDTPIAIPKRRPWLQSSASSHSAVLYTPEITQGSKENNKNASNYVYQEILAPSSSPSLDCTIYDLTEKITKRQRSRSPSPSDQTESKRPRTEHYKQSQNKGYKRPQNENYRRSNHNKSRASRVVSYVKKGWQRVRGFFSHRHARPDYMHVPHRKFPQPYYSPAYGYGGGQYSHYQRGYYQYYDYGFY